LEQRDCQSGVANGFLDVIDDRLNDNGPFFLGTHVTAVDLYLVMLAR